MDRLPTPATSFIGRAEELAEIATLLADPNCRLVTVLGPGGIGKTRLAAGPWSSPAIWRAPSPIPPVGTGMMPSARRNGKTAKAAPLRSAPTMTRT